MARIIHPTLSPILRSQTESSDAVVALFDASGLFVEAPAAGLRLDRDGADLSPRGLAIFGARTNFAPNPRGLGPAGAPEGWHIADGASGISRTVEGGLVRDGIPCVRVRYVGQATQEYIGSIAYVSGSGVAVVPEEAWTASAFVGLDGGEFPSAASGSIFIDEWVSPADLLLSEAIDHVPTLNPLRAQRARLSVVILPVFGLDDEGVLPEYITAGWRCIIPAGASVDFSVLVGAAMLERAADVRPAVMPAGALVGASTSAPADIEARDAAQWLTLDRGTFSAIVDLGSGSGVAGDRGFFRATDGTAAERIDLRVLNGTVRAAVSAAGAGVFVAEPITEAGVIAAAVSYGPAGLALSVNGAPPIVAPLSELPRMPIVDRVILGRLGAGGAAPLNGWLRRFRFRPTQLLGSDLSSF